MDSFFGDIKIIKKYLGNIQISMIKDYISSNILYINNMKNGFYIDKINKSWHSNKILKNEVTQGIIELDTTGFTSYILEIEADVSSEPRYDFLTAFATSSPQASNYWDGGSDNTLKIAGEVSRKTYTKEYSASSKYIYICYRKDGSGDRGQDSGNIYNIKIKGIK